MNIFRQKLELDPSIGGSIYVWHYTEVQMEILSISGKAGSGKDEAYRLMSSYLTSIGKTHTRISFAKQLKDNLSMMFSWDRDRLDNDPVYKEGNTLDDGSPDPACELLGMSRREVMQVYGTDAVRNNLHPDTWIIITKLAMLRGQFDSYDYGFITDCRFLNELEFTKSMGGKSIQIQRIGTDITLTEFTNHSSELEWQAWGQWDHIIKNRVDLNAPHSSLQQFRSTLIDTIFKDNT